ncbi:acetyl esterase/lipase [Kineococcus radiotolerans]|uniref:Acetyl esterase/lipase n=1 Tax=Kineococcus radiotolerans TaxID=131568 RepID=A0A7W4XZG8_KINRA|nr:acetyl esterase/lipase [Kineococcus radiotolerans]
MWLHGGGFFAGRLDQPESDAFARALAGRGVRVVNVDYALAPLLSTRWPCPARSVSGVLRARFPEQVHDVSAVLAHVRVTATGPVLLGGASAGACLAAGTAVAAAAGDGGQRLDGAVLAYGFFHARLPPRPRVLRARLRGRRRFTHTRWPVMAMNLNYTGSRSRRGDASAFPGGHRLVGFPPTLLLDADRDAMRASSDLFAADLAAAGVRLEHQVLPESVHGFLGRPHEPAFTAGVDVIAAVIARWTTEMAETITATASAASGAGDAEHRGPGR